MAFNLFNGGFELPFNLLFMNKGSLLKWENYYSRFCYFLGEGYGHEKAFQKVQFEFEDQTGFEIIEVRGFSSYYGFKNRITRENKK